MSKKYDFSGWATRNNVRCSDGRVIIKDAFKDNDGKRVPLIWMHDHSSPFSVLGHADLENREEGVYAYCKFNDDTDAGRDAKKLVEHGDVVSLSIYANQLTQQGPNVVHGKIREVSLVLAPANPEARIEDVIRHGDDDDVEEAVIYNSEGIELYHAESAEEEKPKMAENEKTVQDVLDTLNDEQKAVVDALLKEMFMQGVNSASEEKASEGHEVKHNVFDNDDGVTTDDVISHSDMEAVIRDAKRYGSMKESAQQHGFDNIIAHADDDTEQYGITNIDYLFPDDRNVTRTPTFIKRPTGWVPKVMNGVKHQPFSRIRSIHADITAEEARAKGYITGKRKKDEVFSLLKRSTSPQTVYKRQKMNRDDISDITDFDVVSWIKTEMRGMLDEELARAILIGDGRAASDDDKISEDHIRSIANDDELYAFDAVLAGDDGNAGYKLGEDFIETVIKNRRLYKGSGNPTLYIGETMLSDLLLLKDLNGRFIYESVASLEKTMRVKEIVTVPFFDVAGGVTASNANDVEVPLYGILVNLEDYTVGADKGGSVNMFDDFDIDYNQEKYLIETRCSGALTIPYSAMKIEGAADEDDDDEVEPGPT